MTRYTLTNILYPTADGKEFKIETTFDDFEGVAEKVALDLTSVWKGIVILPLIIKIDLAKEQEKIGTRLIMDGETVSEDNNPIGESFEALEIYSEQMKKAYKDIPTNRGN